MLIGNRFITTLSTVVFIEGCGGGFSLDEERKRYKERYMVNGKYIEMKAIGYGAFGSGRGYNIEDVVFDEEREDLLDDPYYDSKR